LFVCIQAKLWVITTANDPDVQRLGTEINKTIADKGVMKAMTFLDHIQKRIQAVKKNRSNSKKRER